MTKCEGTTRKPYATARRTLVRDERVMKLFCEYTLETRQRGKGVVLLDYNHAVDHVRHCLNSMKKFGSFATIKVEQEVNACCVYCTNLVDLALLHIAFVGTLRLAPLGLAPQ